jgi:hypothetical protein
MRRVCAVLLFVSLASVAFGQPGYPRDADQTRLHDSWRVAGRSGYRFAGSYSQVRRTVDRNGG